MPKWLDEHGLGTHHVGDGDDGQVKCIGLAGLRIDRCGASRTKATAKHIGTEDEIAVRIDGLAGADQRFPPARLAGDGMHIGDMLVAGQRMTDQDRIGFVGVELAIGLVGNAERRQRNTAIEMQRLVGTKIHHRAVGICCFLAFLIDSWTLIGWLWSWHADLEQVPG